MITGDTFNFAIESGITQAYARPSLYALGFFVIHIGGYRYGVCSPDATMLACSFREVEERIVRRGRHSVHFATEPAADKIAKAIYRATYAPNQESERFFGIPQPEFNSLVYANHLMWAPDGDEAFDDGSYVLHFDVKDRVRLIGFKCGEDYHHDARSLSDMWLEADEFYQVLQNWHDAFEAEWLAAPKSFDGLYT